MSYWPSNSRIMARFELFSHITRYVLLNLKSLDHPVHTDQICWSPAHTGDQIFWILRKLLKIHAFMLVVTDFRETNWNIWLVFAFFYSILVAGKSSLDIKLVVSRILIVLGCHLWFYFKMASCDPPKHN